ncbi:MAG TPA: histidine kinase [Candidatus Baltobacteraceae bacterium]|nr:histidine kinase [Candidatus Baltobacteraceae bacterium]
MTFRRPVAWFWLFVIFTAIGIFFSLHAYLSDGSGASLSQHFYYEMTGAYAAMVWVPAIAWLTRAAPFTRATIARALAANLAGAAIYTLLHSSVELLLRFPLQAMVGLHHSLAVMARTTYISEAPSDLVYYCFIAVPLYLIGHALAARDLEAKLAKAQLENLRLQLQPHFLFNTLNAISAVMYEDVVKADRMLAQLSDFMRLVLASGGVEEIPLDEELRMERMYVDIMKTRLERNLALEVAVADDARGMSVPFMLLQPLLENSIRHGMGSARVALALGIGVVRRNGSTVIEVSDNGIGFDPLAPRGIGLTNVAARLQHLYGTDASLAIRARDGGGTLVTLNLPARETSGA